MALVGHISGSIQSNSVIGISGSVIVASKPNATFPSLDSGIKFLVDESSLFKSTVVSSGSLTVKDGTGVSVFSVDSSTGNTVAAGSLTVAGGYGSTGVSIDSVGNLKMNGILTASGGDAVTPDAVLGKAVVGQHPYFTNYAMFGNSALSHAGVGGSGNYSLMASSAGATFLNAPVGASVRIQNDDDQVAQFSDSVINLAGKAATAQTVTIGQTTGASSLTLNAGTGLVTVNGKTQFNNGLSGSLTQLTNGTSYLIAGSGISIVTGSSGAVTISSSGGSGDVVGPASSTDGSVALFDSTTGKLLKNSSLTTADGGASLFVNSNLYVSGSTTFGDATSDTISFTARVSTDLLPSGDAVQNLGSANNRWANVYTGDLHLKNDRGDYTLIEEENMLTIRFNKTGKRYKFLLEAVPELDESPVLKF